MSPRKWKILHVAATPLIAGTIYILVMKQVIKDTKEVLIRRFWPEPPIDHP